MRLRRFYLPLIVLLMGCLLLTAGANGRTVKKKIVVGQNGNLCQGPLIIAYEKGFFKKEGLEVELLKGDYPTLRDGLATGKVDVTDGLVVTWLKPIQGGLDINFTTGIHTGCIVTIALKDSPYKNFKDLKGKTIGISGGIGGGSMNFGYRAILHENGDVKDYNWKDYPAAQLTLALEKKEIDAAIIGEQLGIKAVNEGNFKVIRSSTLDPDFKEEYCCVLAIRGPIIRQDPKTAKAITRAVIRAAKWVAAHKEETVKLLLAKKYVLGDFDYNLELVNAYKYIPSVAGGKQAIVTSIEEFKKLGLFDASVNVAKEANKIFVTYPDVEN
jgi:NitT/TauT family transport system substrate-binding protein